MVAPTERENSLTARNGGPTWPEDRFLSPFVHMRREMAHPGMTKGFLQLSPEARGRQQRKSRTPRGEIKLKSWEIKADFLEINLGNQPNPPAPPTFTTYDVIFEGNHGKSKRNQEISYAKIACCRPLVRGSTVSHYVIHVFGFHLL